MSCQGLLLSTMGTGSAARFLFATVSVRISSPRRDLSVTQVVESRIKWRATHAPYFHVKKTAKHPDEPVTAANRAFLDRVLRDSYCNGEQQMADRYAYVPPKGTGSSGGGEGNSSPLKSGLEPWPRGTWEGFKATRVGLLGRKIGVIPLWQKDGTCIMTTMIHIEDNHVVRYIPPEDFAKTVVAQRRIRPRVTRPISSIDRGCLVVGALSADPAKFTKDYCGLFSGSGVVPKKMLARFPVSPGAVIQPGTPLYASHFQVGQFVDVEGRTSRRGFHGVMKRWGFSGMPSDRLGTTKSHRRPGCIGSGRDKGRVWPGQKLPGHIGGDFRVMPGLQVLRINHRHNVLYVTGQAVPGEPGEFVKVYDTKVTPKAFTESPRFFPTCYPEDYDELPEEEYAAHMHKFEDPTITFK